MRRKNRGNGFLWGMFFRRIGMGEGGEGKGEKEGEVREFFEVGNKISMDNEGSI